MRIIYPEQTYKDALLLAGITKLETRREDLCLKTLTKITRGGPLTQHVIQTRSNKHNYFIRSLIIYQLINVELIGLKIAFSQIQLILLIVNSDW